MDISANKMLNITSMPWIWQFATYDVQLPDIYLTKFLYNL